MFFGKPRKKIKLIYSHRIAPTNVVKIVGLCESVKKEDTILRNLTLTLKVKPRLKKSHQTIFATRQKKTLPLLKKKKKRKQEERRKIKAIFIRKEIHKELGVCNFFTRYKRQSSIHFRVVSSMVSQE